MKLLLTQLRELPVT